MAVRKISRDGYTQARARRRQALAEPHAGSVHYMARARTQELAYSGGLIRHIDPKDVLALKDLPRSALVQAYVASGGDGLTFGGSEVAAVSIPGLVARPIPVDIERRAVATVRKNVHSTSKAKAARRNSAKGDCSAGPRPAADM